MRDFTSLTWAGALALTVLLAAACGDKKKSDNPAMGSGGDGGSGGSAASGGSSGESGETTTTEGSGGNTDSGGSGGSAGSASGGAAGEASIAWGEAGFIDIESVPVALPRIVQSIGGDLETAPTRLFYSYLPAENPDAPVFVFAGANVGISSTASFAAYGIGPITLDADEPTARATENDASWLEMGSLLFIDPRQTGFSYSTLDAPEVDDDRGYEYAPLNFNEFVDAASMVRALLRFLADHAERQKNPIVLVAEGDGGIRASLMLSYLLYPDELRDPEADYVDETLADEIEDHFASVFPGDDVDAAVASEQFGWQVLIQPVIGGAQQVAQRDTEEVEWTASALAGAQKALTTLADFETLLGLAPGDVEGLPASQRQGAFRWDGRFASESYGVLPDASEEWIDELGELELYDRYFIADNSGLTSGGVYRRNQPAHCAKFLRSLLHVDTLVTNALLDTGVMTSGLVDALLDCSIVLDAPDYEDDPIDGVDVDVDPRSGVDRPGWLVVNFNELSEVGATTRTIRWPEYPTSGHAVHWTEPGLLKEDVGAFLSEAGLDL